MTKSDPKIKSWEFFQTNMVYYYFSLQCENSPLRKTLIFTPFPLIPNMNQWFSFGILDGASLALSNVEVLFWFVEIGGNYDSQNV